MPSHILHGRNSALLLGRNTAPQPLETVDSGLGHAQSRLAAERVAVDPQEVKSHVTELRRHHAEVAPPHVEPRELLETEARVERLVVFEVGVIAHEEDGELGAVRHAGGELGEAAGRHVQRVEVHQTLHRHGLQRVERGDEPLQRRRERL